MVIFHSYVSLPEGNYCHPQFLEKEILSGNQPWQWNSSPFSMIFPLNSIGFSRFSSLQCLTTRSKMNQQNQCFTSLSLMNLFVGFTCLGVELQWKMQMGHFLRKPDRVGAWKPWRLACETSKIRGIVKFTKPCSELQVSFILCLIKAVKTHQKLEIHPQKWWDEASRHLDLRTKMMIRPRRI